MRLRIKQWGNGSGICFTKEFMRSAGIKLDDTLNAEIINRLSAISLGIRVITSGSSRNLGEIHIKQHLMAGMAVP